MRNLHLFQTLSWQWSMLSAMAINSQIGESPTTDNPITTTIILDLDDTLLNTEQTTKSVLEEVLAKYGKVVDQNKEEKMLGMIHKDAVTAIVKDYDLPLSPRSYSQFISPMYREKWSKSKPLLVPFDLASNSARENIDLKISHHAGK